MNILYLSYWGVNEGLCVSAIYPHLHILSENPKIKTIFFVTIERDKFVDTSFNTNFNSSKIQHLPLFSKGIAPKVVNKMNDFILILKSIRKIIKVNSVEKTFSHGALGGALLYLSCRKKIPFYIFFEPHSAYMLESKTWRKGLKYLFQKHWENKQIKYATRLFSVTHNYKNKLLLEGFNKDKIEVVPNFVSLENFAFNEEKRNEVRKDNNIPEEAIVGIYVGKFGGIYMNDDAFFVFSQCLTKFKGNFFLIILSPTDRQLVLPKLEKHNFPLKQALVKSVLHEEVPHYLSSADFAFSLQQPKPSNRFLCPLKNGEYWANGLPILMVDGVGDDAEIVKKTAAGALFSLHKNNLEEALNRIEALIEGHQNLIEKRAKIQLVAKKFRNVSTTVEALDAVFLSKG